MLVKEFGYCRHCVPVAGMRQPARQLLLDMRQVNSAGGILSLQAAHAALESFEAGLA